MSLDSVLAAGQRAAERMMTDTCRITAPGTGQGPFNPSTGDYDPPPPVTVYEGKCRITPPNQVNPYQADAAGTSWQVEQWTLSVPIVGSESIASGNTVTYLTSAHDASLEGRVFGVAGLFMGSQTTSRRMLVKATVGTGA